MPARSRLPAAGAWLALAGALWFWFLQPPCPLRAATGLKCPLCGISRALQASGAGHWREAFYWHALLLPCLLFLAWSSLRLPRWPWWAAAGLILLLFSVLRNLPVYLLY